VEGWLDGLPLKRNCCWYCIYWYCLLLNNQEALLHYLDIWLEKTWAWKLLYWVIYMLLKLCLH
jgi:hypothetical protein